MIKKTLSLLLIALLLAGCGGSSKSSPKVEEPPKVDETPKVEAASIIGDWTTQPSCRWNSSTTNYESVLVKISADKIQVLRTHFADTDNNCSQSSVSSSADEYSYSLGEKLTPTNALVTVQQMQQSTVGKRLMYLSEDGKQLVLSEAASGETYPSEFSIAENYVRKDTDLTPAAGKGTVAVLDHFGLNLRDGKRYQDEGNHDLGTTTWSPTNLDSTGSGSGWDTGIWIRPNYRASDNDASIYIQDMGEKALSAGVAIPTSWAQQDVDNMDYLKQGHLYVMRLLDGKHAKVRVLHQPAMAPMWPVLVEYQLIP